MKKIILLSLVISLMGCSKNNNSISSNESTIKDAEIAALSDPIAAPAKTELGWTYDDKTDEMRGDVTKVATIASINQVNFDFPYEGGSNLIIGLKKINDEPTDVIFAITKGQYSCSSISNNCFASIKFDNEEIYEVPLSEPEEHSSDTLFISHQADADKFLSSLLTSKKVIIELPFYKRGLQQFKFSLPGLKWTSPKENVFKNTKSVLASDAKTEAETVAATTVEIMKNNEESKAEDLN